MDNPAYDAGDVQLRPKTTTPSSSSSSSSSTTDNNNQQPAKLGNPQPPSSARPPRPVTLATDVPEVAVEPESDAAADTAAAAGTPSSGGADGGAGNGKSRTSRLTRKLSEGAAYAAGVVLGRPPPAPTAGEDGGVSGSSHQRPPQQLRQQQQQLRNAVHQECNGDEEKVRKMMLSLNEPQRRAGSGAAAVAAAAAQNNNNRRPSVDNSGFEDVPIDDVGSRSDPPDNNGGSGNNNADSAAHQGRTGSKDAVASGKAGHQSTESSLDSRYEDDTSCGIGKWRPAFLQKFANPWSFMAVFGMSMLLQGVFFTYFVSVITTIEKRFEIKSRTTGFVMAGNEISEILFAVLLTYYGGKGHRPRWVSCGIWCISLACFIMASPNFILGSGVADSPTDDLAHFALNASARKLSDLNKKLCRPNPQDPLAEPVTPANCDQHGEDAVEGLSLIFFAFFVAGFGISVVQPLGLSYYDDNVKPSQAPVFHGVLSAARVIGPFLGYILGSLCLRLYVNPGSPPLGVELKDPRWIGAWWLGFIILGSLLLVAGFFIFVFPKELPTKKSKAVASRSKEGDKKPPAIEAASGPAKKKEENASNGPAPPVGGERNVGNGDASGPAPKSDADPERKSNETTVDKNAENAPDAEDLFPGGFDASTRELPAMKEIPAAIKRLLTNKIFMFHMVAVNFHLLANIGFFAFSPKYLESQFRVSASTSNMAVGFAGVLVMAVGMLTAGYVIKRFKPGPRVITGYHVVVTGLNIIGLLGALSIGCSSINLFGTSDASGQLNLSADCNANCNCSTAEYNAVCVELTDVHFYNPCFGGCTGETIINKMDAEGKLTKQTVYTGCTCGAATRNFTGSTPVSPEMDLSAGVQGFCASAVCSTFVSYLVVIGAIKAVSSTARVGNLMVTMRSVEKRDKSIAIGFSLVVFSVFAFIPTPIFYGAIIDSTCLIWRETKCKTKGNCAFYDSDRFRVALHLTPAAMLLVSFVMELLVWSGSKSLNFYEHKIAGQGTSAPGSSGNKRNKDKQPDAIPIGTDNPAYNPNSNS